MSKKVKWVEVVKDFKERNPEIVKRIWYWCPYDFMTVLIYLDDGTKLTYDFTNHKATVLDSTWK